MKYLIILLLVTVAVTAQKGKLPLKGYRRPLLRIPPPLLRSSPLRSEYAASLGGAPVGLYGKSSGLDRGFDPGFGNSEVSGAALGGAKVGLYGKERPGKRVFG